MATAQGHLAPPVPFQHSHDVPDLHQVAEGNQELCHSSGPATRPSCSGRSRRSGRFEYERLAPTTMSLDPIDGLSGAAEFPTTPGGYRSPGEVLSHGRRFLPDGEAFEDHRVVTTGHDASESGDVPDELLRVEVASEPV